MPATSSLFLLAKGCQWTVLHSCGVPLGLMAISRCNRDVEVLLNKLKVHRGIQSQTFGGVEFHVCGDIW